MLKKEWALIVISTLLTLGLALGLIRWLAPQIFGVPVDLQMVSVNKSRVPFYELVFNQEGIGTGGYSVADPYTVQRGTALMPGNTEMGPHDLLGFRNMAVPNVADVIVIGDSQTYAMGVPFAESWPQRLQSHLKAAGKDTLVYSMALGGWAPPQYLYVLKHALRLQPRVIVVAFYSGNDPVETYTQVYGSPQWARLRSKDDIQTDGFPQLTFPPPREDQWRVDLPGERWLHFTAKGRRINVMDHPLPDEGWRLMEALAAEMSELARAADTQLLFTIIPTREYAYAPYLHDLKIEPSIDYAGLVAEEAAHLDKFSAALRKLANSHYASSIEALQQAVREDDWAYPNGVDGHPRRAGHDAIARALTAAVASHVPGTVCGRFRVASGNLDVVHGYASEGGDYWLGSAPIPPEWTAAPLVSQRDLMRLRLRTGAGFLEIATREPECPRASKLASTES